MVNKPGDGAARRPPDTRSTAARLSDALAELAGQQASGGSPGQPTATALCQLAGISRNALYCYHPEVLQALRKIQRQQRSNPGPDGREMALLRERNNELLQQVNKLAALVDHYYAAWEESGAMLERRERALAELRRKVESKVAPIRGLIEASPAK